MNNLIKHIQKLNEIYSVMKKNYQTLDKMFHNHSVIRQKIKLSEQIMQDAFIMIVEKEEETETRRQFNKIIKGIKEEKK